MPGSRPPYPAVFRQRMIALLPFGRTPEDMAAEFEPSAQAIRNRVAPVDAHLTVRVQAAYVHSHGTYGARGFTQNSPTLASP